MSRAAQRTSLGVGVIVLATSVAYIPALGGGYVWDDDYHVTENQTLQSPSGLYRIWFDLGATPQYYPLVFSSFWIEYALWGLKPFGYHLDNVLLHAANAVLLWFVLRRLSVPGAWLVAAIFALHPVHVESVAWITERKNVLSGAFYLASLLAYLGFCAFPDGRPAHPRWGWYVLAAALFLCALFSKTVTCSLPAVILLLLWYKHGRLRRQVVLPLIPMFIVGLIMALTTIWLEKHSIAARGPEWEFSFLERCLIAGRALWFYLSKLIWPSSLTFIYPRWEIDAGQWWQYLYPVFFLGLIAGLWLARARSGKAPLAAALIFAGTLLPALGFFNVYPMRYSFVGDHFQYLASIAPIALVTAGLAIAAKKLGASGTGKTTSSRTRKSFVYAQPLAGAVILAVLATLTWRQGRVYANHETLWRDTLAKNPSAALAHLNLGGELEKQGRFEDAIFHWNEVIRLGGEAHMAHNNLGLLLEKLGRVEEAIEHYRMAIAIDQRIPDPFNNLAWVLATHPDAAIRNGRQAVGLAEQAVRLTNAQHPVVLETLAAAYAEAGRFEDAIKTVRLTLQRIKQVRFPDLATELEAQLRLYESGQAYHTSAGGSVEAP